MYNKGDACSNNSLESQCDFCTIKGDACSNNSLDSQCDFCGEQDLEELRRRSQLLLRENFRLFPTPLYRQSVENYQENINEMNIIFNS